MDYLQILVLTTGSRDEAIVALHDLKRLEHAGWIELTDYALFGPDSHGTVHVYECAEPKGLASGGISPKLVMPAPGDSSAGHFALAVLTAEQYAERVAEELESRGRTVRRYLQGYECRMALRGAVERAKANLRWLQGVLRSETEKAKRLDGEEREVLESTIAAGRAELGAEQEVLQVRLRTLAAALEAELRENRDQLRESEGEAQAETKARIEGIESQLAECHEFLIVSILDHLDALAGHESELKVKLTQANSEAADVIEAQLHELQVRLRRSRAELTATLGESSARLRRYLGRLRVEAALGRSTRTPEIERRINTLEQSQRAVKADARRLERVGPRAWNELAGNLRQSWQTLCKSVAGTEHRCP